MQGPRASFMRFRVRLYRGNSPIHWRLPQQTFANGTHLCLGDLVLKMHSAAKQGINALDELIGIADTTLERLAGPTQAAEYLPYFNRSFHYGFDGSGAWNPKNLRGELEILLRGKQFVQIGVRVGIRPIMLLGSKRSLKIVRHELRLAVEKSYEQQFQKPVVLEQGTLSLISDDTTNCCMYVMPVDPQRIGPRITCVIDNRAIWDDQ